LIFERFKKDGCDSIDSKSQYSDIPIYNLIFRFIRVRRTAILTAINPANGKLIHTYEEHSTREVEEKVDAAHRAFLSWREMTFPQRVEKLRNASRVLVDKKEEYAALMATEMGKPVRDGRA
jgi:acyl-CoA reductase-like NAD-dependent aldehyde dehydrogenase